MKRTLYSALSMLLLAGVVQAAEPTKLSDSQMDAVSAGGGGNPYEALVGAMPGGFTMDGAQLNHKWAKLRFQPVAEDKGIAIRGGANANFEKSRLRSAGDGFGAVVVLY